MFLSKGCLRSFFADNTARKGRKLLKYFPSHYTYI